MNDQGMNDDETSLMNKGGVLEVDKCSRAERWLNEHRGQSVHERFT